MIERSKQVFIILTKLVEEKYTIANGYEFDASVIYGDTDSISILFIIQWSNLDLQQ